MEEKIKELGNKRHKFNKDRFDKIPEERRTKILDSAIIEFACNGFKGTNINNVAKKAGISIGSLYSYFNSKEDLFLTVVEKLLSVLEGVLEEIDVVNDDIFEIINQLFIKAHDYAVTYPEMNQIYLDMSTHSLTKLSNQVSGRLETITVNLYKKVIEKAKAEGKINDEIDERMLAFCLDNLIMMFQFSFTSNYYKERMLIFLGEEMVEDHKEMIRHLMTFIISAIAPK